MRPKENHKTKEWVKFCKCDKPMQRLAHNVTQKPVFVCGKCGRSFDQVETAYIKRTVTDYLLHYDDGNKRGRRVYTDHLYR